MHYGTRVLSCGFQIKSFWGSSHMGGGGIVGKNQPVQKKIRRQEREKQINLIRRNKRQGEKINGRSKYICPNRTCRQYKWLKRERK